MTKQVLFIQGGGEGAHDEWDNRLVDSLTEALGAGYEVRYPRMPDENNPSFVEWKKALEREVAKLDHGAIFVGHSVGATILVNALAADPPKWVPGGIFLIAAPFIGDGGWDGGEVQPRPKLGADLPQDVPIHLYHGDADETAPIAHLGLYARAIPQAVVHRLRGRDHQLNNDLKEVAADLKSLR